MDDTWTEAASLPDLTKLETALRERSGGSMIAAFMDVFHIAQRRHLYRGTCEQACQLLKACGRYVLRDEADTRRIMIRPI